MAHTFRRTQRRRLAMLLAALSAGAVVLLAGGAQAQPSPYRYCAVTTQDDVQFADCTYSTFQQCLATISGLGGFCRENPRYFATPYDDRAAPPMRPPRR